MAEVSESQPAIPHRGELFREVRRLQRVSEVMKDLTSRKTKPEEELQHLNSTLTQCFADQSRIVHTFYSLSEDEKAKNALLSTIGSIDEAMRRLGSALSSEEVTAVNEEISGCIDRWVDELESLIQGVIERAPPSPDDFRETVDDFNV